MQKACLADRNLKICKNYLPFNERLTFYNAIIKPVMMYGSLIWGSTSTNNLRRVFRLHKRAARVILGERTKEERTINLFKKLEWLPFYDKINVNKLCLVFKCLNDQCPEYLSNTLRRVSDISTGQSRHGRFTLRCPKYSRETEGGKTFAVVEVKEWSKVPNKTRSSQNVKLFKKNYVNYLKKSYIGLDHFSI